MLILPEVLISHLELYSVLLLPLTQFIFHIFVMKRQNGILPVYSFLGQHMGHALFCCDPDASSTIHVLIK